MKKIKHDHKGTKLLKLGIFASLMLAPLLAIAFKCAYVTFNKNAKDSYSQTIERQNISLVNQQLPLYDVTYNLSNDIPQTTTTYTFNVDNVKYNNGSLTTSQIESLESATYIRMWYGTSYNANYMTWENAGTNISAASNSVNITFDLLSVNTGTNVDLSIFDNYFYRGTSNNTLDNAFYYAIDEAMESPYFAWARTSALYTATSGLTNGMGITTQAIPTLIVYWLILTAIYIIIDIVVELFTALTHMITSKLDT